MKRQHVRADGPLRAALFALLAAAGSPSAAVQDDGSPPKEIRVQARKNPGDVSYRSFYEMQRRMTSYLPAEPRLFDFSHRISFTRLSLAEQDAYEPPSWAVSIVGNELDVTVPMRRGGYFLLPYLEDAYKDKATLMFRDQSKRNYVGSAWIMRIDESRRLPYAGFGQAMAQLHALQKAIPLKYLLNFYVEKYAKYDGLKACFRDGGGVLRIDGREAADVVSGNCSILKFDPAKAAGDQVIAFDGALDLVTLIETEPYLAAQASRSGS